MPLFQGWHQTTKRFYLRSLIIIMPLLSSTVDSFSVAYPRLCVPRTLRLTLSPTALVYRVQQLKGRLCLSINSLAFKCCCVPSICKAINCNSRYWSTQVKPLDKLKFVNRPAAPHCLATDETMPPSILYNRCLLDMFRGKTSMIWS